MTNDRLKLFDEFERNSFEPSAFSEPRWSYLNRTARQQFSYVRELLQNWFDEYRAPLEKRQNLCKGFRSGKDEEHISSFFEIYLYQLFRSQGFDIEVEPEWEQGRPDFLLTSPNGEQIVLEATGCYPSRWFGGDERTYAEISDYLNENLRSRDYLLHLSILRTSKQPFSFRKMCQEFQFWLNELDYNGILAAVQNGTITTLEDLPSRTWENREWVIQLKASPRMGESRGIDDIKPLGMRLIGPERITTGSNIQSRLNEKYRHYGDIDISYILALNILDPFYSDRVFADAVLGQEAWILNKTSSETIETRISNGAWFSGNSIRQTRMSAVCVFHELFPITMHAVNPVVWHHPYAKKPLDSNLLCLSQQIPNMDTNRYELRDGQHPCSLLGIDVLRITN